MSTAVVENLDAKCVLAMILGAVRVDRFCDGALLGFFEQFEATFPVKEKKKLPGQLC